jgi:hypothetical protein
MSGNERLRPKYANNLDEYEDKEYPLGKPFVDKELREEYKKKIEILKVGRHMTDAMYEAYEKQMWKFIRMYQTKKETYEALQAEKDKEGTSGN